MPIPLDPLPTPITRSSDLGLAGDPLGYCLRRRCGIVSAFSDSEAMNCGSWFHRAFHTQNPLVELTPALDKKMVMLKGACAVVGVSSDAVIEMERQDFITACTWFEAAKQVRFLDESVGFAGNYIEWLNQPRVRNLGVEILITTPMGPHGMLACAQLDLLLYFEDVHILRPLDIKTSADTPKQRFLRCVIEPQVHHYSHIAYDALPMLIDRFALPGDTVMDGMYHVGIQKPTIKLSGKDRDYNECAHKLLSGPRKGETEMRKTYIGDPKPENFRHRCEDWYLGQGEYLDKADERAADPPVNVSFTPFESVASRRYMYDWWRTRAEELAVAPFSEYSFPPGPNSLWRETPMAPFYLLSPGNWPSIIAQEGFHCVNRDDGVPTEPAIKVLGAELPVL